MVDDEQGTGLLASGDNRLSIREPRRDRLFAVDRTDAAAGAGNSDLGMRWAIGGDRNDVERLAGQHLPPVGVGARACALSEPLAPSGVPAAARQQLHTGALRVRLRMGTVQMGDLLPSDR